MLGRVEIKRKQGSWNECQPENEEKNGQKAQAGDHPTPGVRFLPRHSIKRYQPCSHGNCQDEPTAELQGEDPGEYVP